MATGQADLLTHSALEQAALVRRGEVSAVELCDLYLGRIAAHDDKVGAFVEIIARRARRNAEKADAQRRRGGELPPFLGVPVGVKDLQSVRGMFSRFGSRAFRYFWSPFDDLTVTALRRAGFIILGKLSTSELGILPIVETAIHPPTRNPYNLEHSAGGSSGGSGAAVAAGLLPIALGSDGGGSIRIPAACNGLIGYKASRGRIPSPFARVDRLGMSAVGSLARTVDDAHAFAHVLRSTAPLPTIAPAGPPRRIKWMTTPPIGTTAPEIADGLAAVVATLAAAGHTVSEGEPSRGELAEFFPLWAYFSSTAPVPLERLTEPVTQWLRAEGKKVGAAAAERVFHTIKNRVEAWFGDADFWVTPTMPILPPRVGQWQGLPPKDIFEGAAQLGYFTAIFNVSGHPAIAIPAGLSKSGLPLSVQVIGRPGQDDDLFAFARSFAPTAQIAPAFR